ncbi:MAG TPA: DNA polymerase III subunit gamma/tau [Planctomycetaceae bacterium]|nr:DNA polymerase III subunit gamma/tau [Planctomycetaceae bacterium]
MSDDLIQPAESSAPSPDYVVVARRYRPQVFEDLIGQEHVAQALTNAITTNRVGHAYLFTGARGVGKTSAARIFAKALNCVEGPAPVPCNRCEICQSISSGEDVDILEIDGASNRGIDEIRQLRQNANVRPSRARLKIYIIDEVHMLTREAFNALLKTLEEPPKHVKFIFCTTDPNKLPITILSRCQRFDFAGIQTTSIAERLGQIAQSEGVEAERDALEMLARRAAGSMRDGQSLLEQLLAFASGRITLADVHGMLGTAADGRLEELIGCLVDRNAAGVLAGFDAALGEGVDPGLLLEQLFGYLRDCLAAAVGCPPSMFVYASPGTAPRVAEIGEKLGVQAILAAMQILDQTLSRMRQSTQARILAELALVRISELADLDDLGSLLSELRAGTLPSVATGAAAGDAPKKNAPRQVASNQPTGGTPSRANAPRENSSEDPATAPPSDESEADPAIANPLEAGPPLELTTANVSEIWDRVVGQCSGLLAENARQVESLAISAPNRLVILLKQGYTFAKSICERPENATRLRQALAKITGRPVEVEFRVEQPSVPAAGAASRPQEVVTPQQRILQIADHPMVKRAAELFGAEATHVADPKKST